MKRACFVLIGVDTYFGYGFACPAHNTPAKMTICGVTECFTHHYSIPHSIAFDQGVHFTAIKYDNEPMLMEITVFTMLSTTLKQLV